MRPATAAKAARAMTLYQQGHSLKRIGELMGVPFGGVRYWLQCLGVQRRQCGQRPHEHKDAADIRKLRADGWTLKRIGRHYGKTWQWAQRILNKKPWIPKI